MSFLFSKEDHPRLCGEKTDSGWDSSLELGSPPPMRGKAGTSRLQNVQKGITPAYAGKSGDTVLCSLFHEDHPRLCGEKLAGSRLLQENLGSPPPMRGKGSGSRCRCSSRRITPAYAGKSRRHLKLLLEIEDHPRLCGEKRLLEFGCS